MMRLSRSTCLAAPLLLACNGTPSGETTTQDGTETPGDGDPGDGDGDGDGDPGDSDGDPGDGDPGDGDGDGGDITDAVFSDRSPSCTDYIGMYTASATDQGTNTPFMAWVNITANGDGCTVTSNGIPNHTFDDAGGFVTPVSEVEESYNLAGVPTDAPSPTGLTLMYDNAIFRNGVKLDLLAAACYGVGPEPLGQEKIGCMQENTPWRYDPMSPNNGFGTDSHHAHTQPDGAYHYHGDPKAMFDQTGAAPSGLIGWAADGYPIFGPYFDDNGTIRKAVSGYTLKPGQRVSQVGEGAFPGGNYDGTFIDDYEFTDAGDLDACNGMTVNGVYGYYVSDAYPWVLKCFKGAPDPSFNKMG